MHQTQLELFSTPPLPYIQNENKERVEYLEWILTQIGLKVRSYQETKEDSADIAMLVLEEIPSLIDIYFSKYN